MEQNNVRIYMDLKCIRIKGKHYVNLEEDIHIASTVRIKKKTCLIKPNLKLQLYVMVKSEKTQIYIQDNLMKFQKNDKGFIVNQPGLQIIIIVAILSKDRSLPLLIVNNKNKFIKIHRHGLLAIISGIQNNVNITNVNSVIQNKECDSKLNIQDLDVPAEYRSKIYIEKSSVKKSRSFRKYR